ncbi:hypothetical protein TCAL_16936 [Tigriopus californicus]|uniref:Uncharacterized protein n=1 Tax=Tigriopus californicus TaxID=6832 RepID=A0A553NPD0_TIGCA|nr:hypothetical protein TCAL_16936 [Tigriopus californicus]
MTDEDHRINMHQKHEKVQIFREMEARRQRVAALLEADVKVSAIMAQEKCSRSFIYKVKDLVEAGDSLGRKTELKVR